MPKVEVTECKKFTFINKEEEYEGCPYFSTDREYGQYCACAKGSI